MTALKFNLYVLFFALTGILSSSLTYANGFIDPNYLTIKSVKVREIFTDPLGVEQYETISSKDITQLAQDLPADVVDPLDRAGKVISVARDLVALGEDIYQLVIKGKPTNTTSYAPISVIPRIDGEAVDILSTETWRSPVKRSYEVIYENVYGFDVVTFRYSVLYSYGGSYDGKGSYLTAVQILPEYVRTLFGYDFTATMKLGGIQNQGTRENPIAGATILMEYTVSTILVANNEVVSFFITGKGDFKKL